MPIISGYDSDEDVDPVESSKDAFNLAALPSAKRPRVDAPVSHTPAIQAAPDVLAEVQSSHFLLKCRVLKIVLSRIL